MASSSGASDDMQFNNLQGSSPYRGGPVGPGEVRGVSHSQSMVLSRFVLSFRIFKQAQSASSKVDVCGSAGL